jgi:hypothetical protein
VGWRPRGMTKSWGFDSAAETAAFNTDLGVVIPVEFFLQIGQSLGAF